jgi:hypothetical protein
MSPRRDRRDERGGLRHYAFLRARARPKDQRQNASRSSWSSPVISRALEAKGLTMLVGKFSRPVWVMASANP